MKGTPVNDAGEAFLEEVPLRGEGHQAVKGRHSGQWEHCIQKWEKALCTQGTRSVPEHLEPVSREQQPVTREGEVVGAGFTKSLVCYLRHLDFNLKP